MILSKGRRKWKKFDGKWQAYLKDNYNHIPTCYKYDKKYWI